jgi:hypothetical protein
VNVATTMREEFVQAFGEEAAKGVEKAARMHVGARASSGSDTFRSALHFALGYQCIEVDEYREHHGLTLSYPEVQAWILARRAWFLEHDGALDTLAIMAGSAFEFLRPPPAEA